VVEPSAPPGERQQGLRVLAADETAAAGRAGVRAGDTLVALDGDDLYDPADLVARSRRVEAHRPVTFRVRRGEEAVELRAPAEPLRAERIDGADVVLGHVTVRGHRLRTIATRPRSEEPPAAILYLQGIAGASVEHPLDPEHPLFRTIAGWTRGGFATMRVERSGVGDSEGPHYRDGDFETEVDMYRAALAAVDAPEIFLFGQSLGGMVAPLVASDARVTGVMVFGTSAQRWHDCMVETRARQRRLAGRYDGAEMSRWTEMHALVCDGRTPEEVFALRPDLRVFETSECRGAHLFGRHATFFHQLSRTDLAAAWRALDRDVLVLHGEYDWICSRAESDAVAHGVNGAHPESALHVELPRIGHDGLAHASLEESFRNPERGVWDGRVVETTLGWMRVG
jgi:pimeloyl-ACP methyl ester carboxylesterase